MIAIPPLRSPATNGRRKERNWNRPLLDTVLRELEAIYGDLLDLESEFEPKLAACLVHQESARNLIHYLALRRHDIRQLQEQLAALGLSSLGRTESHVLAGVEAVLKVLHQLAKREWLPAIRYARDIDFAQGKILLRVNTDSLLGPAPPKRSVRIMVTMPSEAAHNYQLVRELLADGMNCLRINCAHDDPHAWTGMLANLQKAREELGKQCTVEMDLTGPKLRTGAIDPSSQTIKWRPQRDLRGRVTAPALVWLTSAESPEPPPHSVAGCLQIPAAILAKIAKNDRIRFKDLRSKSRLLQITDESGSSRMASCFQTAYLGAGNTLAFTKIPKDESVSPEPAQARVAPLSSTRSFLILKPGDQLILTRSAVPGRPAADDEKGRMIRPATIPCTLPEVFADIRVNEPIWFDDGKIGGLIESVGPEEVVVRITTARPGGERLGPDKGINLPGSAIRLPALTEKDITDLAFIVRHADLVGLSFVRRPEDVVALQAELDRLNAPKIGIVLKIETRTAFEHLPAILLQAMHGQCVGVMIARGDLAVECGWQRLAEVQEEILWICEAAHMPVIWATQVLENLAKKGAPSRAEITDAAMGERAECVMLNKGPHLVEAVRVLDDILCRMEAHQSKKSARLRPLHLSTLAIGRSKVGRDSAGTAPAIFAQSKPKNGCREKLGAANF